MVVESVMWIGRVYIASWQIPSCRVAESADGMVEAILSVSIIYTECRAECRAYVHSAVGPLPLCTIDSASQRHKLCHSGT